MHILFLTQVLPYPLDAGPKIRAYYTARYLSRRHEITLLSFVRESDSAESVVHLQSFCRAVHLVPMKRSRMQDVHHLLRSLASHDSFLIRRDWVPEMAELARWLATDGAGVDVIHADQLWMAAYALAARRAVPGHAPRTILDQHNAVFQIPARLATHTRNPFKRALLSLEERKLIRYEAEICRRFDQVVWVTGEDRTALLARGDGGRAGRDHGQNASIIPICADPDNRPTISPREDARRVTFLGGLHWPPNAQGVLWFAREVWPRVSRQLPGAVLTIIGKDPPHELYELRDRFRSSHGGRATIEITGFVEDPRPYLEQTAVFVVPLLAGGGMRVKILDAWRWGLPVVSTPIGAEGMKVLEGENLLLASTPDAFATATVEIMCDRSLRSRLIAGGHRTAVDHYDWRKIYRAWDQVYDRLAMSPEPVA